jgi:hypothetical protein
MSILRSGNIKIKGNNRKPCCIIKPAVFYLFTLFSYAFFFLLSCTSSVHSQTIETPAAEREISGGIYLKTSSSTAFRVRILKTSASLNDIIVIPENFESVNEPFIVKNADPVNSVFTADIDSDGFSELYIITVSAGSGSYSGIYAFASNRDRSVSPVYVKDFYEKGYRGHSRIFLKENRLYRSFPVYNKDDKNCCPSGGTETVQYRLIKGEASWILEIAE